MEVTLLKLTPRGDMVYADFIIEIAGYKMQVKGCRCHVNKNQYYIKYPKLPVDDGRNTPFTPWMFIDRDAATEFKEKADMCLRKVLPLPDAPKIDCNGSKIEEKAVAKPSAASFSPTISI